jgi:hypothetical protein
LASIRRAAISPTMKHVKFGLFVTWRGKMPDNSDPQVTKVVLRPHA